MAAKAAVDRRGIVLEREGTTLVFVAFHAIFFAVRKKLILLDGAVWVVAACALDHPFLDPVMGRHRELRPDVCMTRDAEVLLLAPYHGASAPQVPFGFRVVSRMDIVAGNAGNAGHRMLAHADVALRSCLFVTAQAHLGCL